MRRSWRRSPRTTKAQPQKSTKCTTSSWYTVIFVPFVVASCSSCSSWFSCALCSSCSLWFPDHVHRGPEIRRLQRRGRHADPAGRRSRDADAARRPGRRRGRVGDGRHHRRAARARQAGVAEPRPPRAGHAADRRRADLDGAAVDGDSRTGRRRDQLHRQPVRHHHQRSPRRRPHHRGPAVPRPGRARARQDRRHRRLSGRLLPARGHHARARRQRHHRRRDGGGAGRRVLRDLLRRRRRLHGRSAGRAGGAPHRHAVVRRDAGARRIGRQGPECAGGRIRQAGRDRHLRARHQLAASRRPTRRSTAPSSAATRRGRRAPSSAWPASATCSCWKPTWRDGPTVFTRAAGDLPKLDAGSGTDSRCTSCSHFSTSTPSPASRCIKAATDG